MSAPTTSVPGYLRSHLRSPLSQVVSSSTAQFPEQTVPSSTECATICGLRYNTRFFTYSTPEHKWPRTCWCKFSKAGRRQSSWSAYMISGTTCRPAKGCPTLVQGRWYAPSFGSTRGIDLTLKGPPGQALSDCSAWCIQQARSACSLRSALIGGLRQRCGYDSVAMQCVVFADTAAGLARTLSVATPSSSSTFYGKAAALQV